MDRTIQVNLPSLRPAHQYSWLGTADYFHTLDQAIGYIIMCQVFISFASGILIICGEIAIVAVASKK